MAVSVFANTQLIHTSAQSKGGKCKYVGQAVRALPIRIITVGKKRSPGVQLIVDEYEGKLKPYCSIDDVQVRSNPKNAREGRAQVEDEDDAVMNLIRSDDWVVVLDERGRDIGSEQMAELLGDAGNSGASRLSFCIGGPYGHGQQILKRANVSIKLSSMVLNHQIALVVLMEQLYRLDIALFNLPRPRSNLCFANYSFSLDLTTKWWFSGSTISPGTESRIPLEKTPYGQYKFNMTVAWFRDLSGVSAIWFRKHQTLLFRQHIIARRCLKVWWIDMLQLYLHGNCRT